jgi:hypothetical protein
MHHASSVCQIQPPTWLVEQVGDVVIPIMAAPCNASFNLLILWRIQSQLLSTQSSKVRRCILAMHARTDQSQVCFISKLIDRAVDLRFTEHVNRHQLLPIYQSAYRSCHSAETTIVSAHGHDWYH